MNLSPAALQLVRHEFPPHVVAQALHAVSTRVMAQYDATEHAGARELAYIQPSGNRIATVHITLYRDAEVEGYCDCGMPRCAHLATALLLAISDGAAAPAAWRRELDELLPAPAASVDACLFISVISPKHRYYGEPREPYLAARPGTLGTRGKWIKGDRTWRRIGQDAGRTPVEKELASLLRLWQVSGNRWQGEPDWLELHSMPGHEIWERLTRLRERGVALVAGGAQQRPVVLDEIPLDASITATREGDSLALGAAIARAGEPVSPVGAYFVGDPVGIVARVTDAGAGAEQVTLTPLTAPLPPLARRLATRGQPLVVPASDITDFEAEFLPRLQAEVPVVSPDDSYAVPAPARAELVLSVRYAPPQAHLTWAWRRPGGLVDADFEREVRARAEAVLAEHLPGGSTPGAASTDAGATTTAPADRTLGASAAALFVTEVLPRLRELDGIRVVEDTEPPAYRAAEEAARVTASVEGAGDWFDLHFAVSIGDEAVDFADLFTALTLEEPLFVLPSGTFFPLDGPEFASLRAIIDEARALSDRPSASADTVRLNRHHVDLWSELDDLGVVAAREAEWWLAMQSLGEGEGVVPVEPPASLRAQLRDYQLAGFSWLHFLRTHGLGGILADDMGLGKTLQTIAMMEAARVADPEMKPFLVVAPTSVVGNWETELARFAPELRVATISAMQSRRGATLTEAIADAHVVITSYALFRLEAEDYRALEWSALVIDEAQKIKNPAAQGYRAARDLGAPVCFVLTGTPLENNLLELWALSALAAPGLLGNRTKFTEFYRNPIEKGRDADRLALLRRRLRPFLLRRTKELVASELPPKQEQVLTVDLHPRHRKTYDVRFQRERQRVLGLVDDLEANRFEILKSLTLLRQLALDPALVDAGDAPSAKLEALVELIAEAAEEGHRVLVLSQFTRFLRSAREHAEAAGIRSQYLDGSTTDRPAVIRAFREGGDPAFFISLQAGGVGLNLVEADYVVLLDPWWNPAVEAQAIDRAHRIGQDRPVIVYRIVAKDTIEQKVIALRESKAELFARVLDGEGGFTQGALTAGDIRGLLE
ncbi:MAG: SNF2-related protein [Microbacterium sp.]